jgi:hypothetical protein
MEQMMAKMKSMGMGGQMYKKEDMEVSMSLVEDLA